MRIGELGDVVGVSAKTIRYYESIGLLGEPDRTASGYRSYGDGTRDRLRFIKQAKASGLTLAEIRSILEIKGQGGQTCEHTRNLLLSHIDSIDQQIALLKSQRNELVSLADQASELDPSNCTEDNRCQVISGPSSLDSGNQPSF